MKYLITYFIFFLLGFSNVYAQANLLNARVPQDVGQLNEKQIESNDEEPLPYGFIDDRDILWSKTVWEVVDLDERINFPYYYPTDTLNLGPDRRSLFDVLKTNLRNGNIKEVYGDDYFLEKLTYREIVNRLFAIDTTDAGKEQIMAGEELSEEFINRMNITAAEIRQYKVKGTWYFDKRQGELKYRLLGLCPVAPDLYSLRDPSTGKKVPEDQQELVDLFWIWFPDARESLNTSTVFNTGNSSQPITFDHMLNSRRFNAFIYKEENVYEDRKINDYIFEDALQQLLESERIKNVIRDFEQDMWNN